MGNEVKERLDGWQDSNNGRILVNMLVKSTSICNKYSLHNAYRDRQSVVQGVGRALTGKCEYECNTWTNKPTHFKQHQRDYHKCTIAIEKSQSYYQRQFCLEFGNIPPLGSQSLNHLRDLSHGGEYPRWTTYSVQMDSNLSFILFLQF